LLWLFLFFLIFGAMWYYFQEEEVTESKTNSIIISQPSLDDVSESIIVENIDDAISPDEINGATENLDEVISTYEASTQN